MLAAAFASMLPHAIEIDPDAGLVALFGYLLVHATQHILTPHFHFGEETHHEAMVARWVGTAALLGLLLHTFFDGVAIASAFDVDTSLGMIVFLAILVHKVPEGVTIASIMLVSGNTKTRALQGVALLGATTVAGVLLTSWIEPLARHGLALSAGVTAYVAASNLVPEVQKQKDFVSGAGVFAGVIIYLLARLAFGGIEV
jgi:ZIP family zinc transporter/zinc and cadmium transporter